MNKIRFIFVVALVWAVPLWSQTLDDNESYQQMLELKRQSEAAFDAGDYAEAKRLAAESLSLKEASDKWIEVTAAAYRARSALTRVADRLAEAAGLGAEKNFPEELSEGTELYDKAYAAFHVDENYLVSLETSRKALDILSVIEYISPETTGLPASYTVRLLPGNTDCLWVIAGYDFIYNDPWKWRTIYNANLDIMPDRDNPDLIHPGMVLTIPPEGSEERSGTWENGIIK